MLDICLIVVVVVVVVVVAGGGGGGGGGGAAVVAVVSFFQGWCRLFVLETEQSKYSEWINDPMSTFPCQY